MIEKISIENIRASDTLLIDVRSPSEFLQGHIPEAINLPLFNDDERKIVGTLYKQTSPEAAFIKGLEVVGPKMADFVRFVKQRNATSLTLYCWRGGQRSNSMAWLFNQAGYKVKVLQGGYKSFRQQVLSHPVYNQLSLLIIGGKTGSGKTYFLKELSKLGEQVIDLESIAHHKGSAFGTIGEETQPTTEQFENQLFWIILQLNPLKRIWIEDESRMIGKIAITQALWNTMKTAKVFFLEIPLEERLNHLIHNYTNCPKELLIESFQRIEKRLGNKETNTAIEYVLQDNFKEAAHIALQYYDKTYLHHLTKFEERKIHPITISLEKITESTQVLISLAQEQNG